MFGRTVLAATALAATALTPSATLPDVHAAAHSTTSLSNADNGKTVLVASGDTVKVNLKAMPGDGVIWVWDEPTTSNPDVLDQTSGRTAASGDAGAAFRAARGGRSDITAPRHCVVTLPGYVCPDSIVVWKATIDVR